MENVMQLQDGPGSAAYSPINTEPDSVVIPFTTRSQGNRANVTGPNMSAEIPQLPDPAVGGLMGPLAQLGYSTGFLSFRRMSPFDGRTLVRRTMGVHPQDGPVGYSTRTQRLRNRVEALYNDYTPSAQAAAQEIVRNI